MVQAVWSEALDRTGQSVDDLKRDVHEAADDLKRGLHEVSLDLKRSVHSAATDLRVAIASSAPSSTEVNNRAPLT